MNRRRRLTALLGVLVTVALMVGAAPAQAKRSVKTDAVMDVIYAPLANLEDTSLAVGAADPDIAEATLHHGGSRINVVTRFRAFPGRAKHYVSIVLAGANGQIRQIDYSSASATKWKVTNLNTGAVQSCGLQKSIDHTTGVLKASIKRGCMGNPKKVQGQIAAMRMTNTGMYSDLIFFKEWVASS